MVGSCIEVRQTCWCHPILEATIILSRRSKTELAHHPHIASIHIAKCLHIAEVELHIHRRHITRHTHTSTTANRLILWWLRLGIQHHLEERLVCHACSVERFDRQRQWLGQFGCLLLPTIISKWLHQQGTLEVVQLFRFVRSGVLKNFRTAHQIQIEEGLTESVLDERSYNFLEKWWIMLKQKKVELMAKLLIIGLQLLLLRVGMPLGHPLRQRDIDPLGILDNIHLADRIPLTVLVDLLLLACMQMVDLPAYRPPHLLILIL